MCGRSQCVPVLACKNGLGEMKLLYTALLLLNKINGIISIYCRPSRIIWHSVSFLQYLARSANSL